MHNPLSPASIKNDPSARSPQQSTGLSSSRRNFLLSTMALSAGLFFPFRSVAAEKPSVSLTTTIPVSPQRIMLSCTADMAHSQSVAWRAQTPLKKPVAQITPLTASPLTDKDGIIIQATPQGIFPTLTGEEAHHYAANFTALEPATSYCYRVGEKNHWSEWNVFHTAEAAAAPFRFLYLGDVQNDIRALCTRIMRKSYQQVADARLVLCAGDLVTEGWNDALWDEFAYATSVFAPSIPFLPTPGNHDTKTKKSQPYPYGANPAYHAHFSLPENGPANTPGLNQEAYFVDYQGVRFISVNSNAFDDDAPKEVQTAQLTWLEQCLSQNPNRWTMVTHHHPIYSVSKDRDNEVLRSLLRPLYDKYHVDVVLQGHDHTYGRTHKVAGDSVVDADAPGTVYVVSVSGPKMYEVGPKFNQLMAKTAGHMQMYQVVEVTPDRLCLDSFSLDGKKVDGFQLDKDASGATRYKTT